MDFCPVKQDNGYYMVYCNHKVLGWRKMWSFPDRQSSVDFIKKARKYRKISQKEETND